MSEMDEIIEGFFQESNELLDEMELILLDIESDPSNKEKLDTLFRAMHTVKGSAGLFGFDAVVLFTHEAETVLDQVRNQEIVINVELISLFLETKDHTTKLLDFYKSNAEGELSKSLEERGKGLVLALKGYSNNSDYADSHPSSMVDDRIETIEHKTDLDKVWIISIVFKPDAFRNGIDALSFLKFLKGIGEIETSYLQTVKIPEDESYDPESCYLDLFVALDTTVDKQTIESVFEYADQDCDIHILPPNSNTQHYVELMGGLDDSSCDKIGQMLVSVGAITAKDISEAMSVQETQLIPEPLGKILTTQKVVKKEVVESAIEKQNTVRTQKFQEANFIRVDSRKLGRLIDLVGELVISGAAMDLMTVKHRLPDVADGVSNINSLIGDVRDTALELRMVAIGETFSKFKRVVRDVSRDLNKNIELVIIGGDTELDKTVVEKINDPLTHLVRNSLDHGIESPEDRIANGKDPQGKLLLKAFHDAGQVVIEVSDNGAGLDKEKIVAKAIKNGLIAADDKLSEEDIFNLIFEAGLSTKNEASDLSGRGVGMDVVRRNIEALRGSIAIASQKGIGTTMTIRLPLTLSIIDGFMIEASGERYIIPLTMVEECVELEGLDTLKQKNYINLRGNPLPFLRLGEYFNSSPSTQSNDRKSLVVVKYGTARAGIVVDKLHGEHQTVIKPLSAVFSNLPGLSGTTVLGDGNVALILDVHSLISAASDHANKVA